MDCNKLLERLDKRIEKAVSEIVDKHFDMVRRTIRKEEWEKAVREGIAATGDEEVCDHCEHESFSEGCSGNVPEACHEAAFRLAMKRLEEDDDE